MALLLVDAAGGMTMAIAGGQGWGSSQAFWGAALPTTLCQCFATPAADICRCLSLACPAVNGQIKSIKYRRVIFRVRQPC